MAAAYGAIKPYLATFSDVRVPDPTKTANIMGLMWWVQARVVGPSAANSYYRLLPGLDILRSTGNSWDSTVDDDGGLVGRAVALNQNWKYAVGTTCSTSMLSNHPPTAQLNFTNIS
jgi:hypothetical protein